MTPSGEWYFNGLRNEGSKHGYTINQHSYPPCAETTQYRYGDHHLECDWDDIVNGKFRVVPNNDTLMPLLTAFAKAAARMPRLEQALLWAPLRLEIDGMMEGDEFYENVDLSELTNHVQRDEICKPLAWGIAYTSPNSEGFMDHHGRLAEGARQIWWQVAKWRPEKEVHDIFTHIGEKEHGNKIIEYWEDEQNGTGLADRTEFERFEEQLFPNDFPEAKPRRNKY